MLNPPTDNIYKFAAISGLLILFIPTYYFSIEYIKLEESIIRTNAISEKLSIDLKIFTRNVAHLESKVESIITTKIPTNEDVKKIEETTNLYNFKLSELEKQNVEINTEIEILKSKNKWLTLYKSSIFFTVFCGIFLSIYGFHKWLQIQKKLDKKLTLK